MHKCQYHGEQPLTHFKIQNYTRDRREGQKIYRSYRCGVKIKENQNQYIAQGLCRNACKRPVFTKTLCKECIERHEVSEGEIKQKVFNHYGKFCHCEGCKETLFEFLTIAHINNDGAEERKRIGSKGGNTYYRWLVKNNLPPHLTVLCWNCNSSNKTNGYCPHQSSRLTNTL